MSIENIKPYYQYTQKLKCSVCGIISTSVNKSTKFQNNFCIDCLKDLIINSSNKDIE